MDFRKNPNFKYHYTTWLRKGEIESETFDIMEYALNKKALRIASEKIKTLSGSCTTSFLDNAKNILDNCGICFIYVESLPEAPIYFLTRWFHKKPIIQYSELLLNDFNKFRFTLLHSIGHLALHGKKRIFIESGLEEGDNIYIEQEADRYARKTKKITQ